jgi:hypothetical protein
MHRAIFVVVPGLLGIALSFFVSEILVEKSTTAQRVLAAVACPSGAQLDIRARPRAAAARGGGIASGLYAFCMTPGGESAHCGSCPFLAATPFVLLLGGSVMIAIRAMGRRPSTLDQVAQLDRLLGLGVLSREQYDELKREVLANPQMTRERLTRLMERRDEASTSRATSSDRRSDSG